MRSTQNLRSFSVTIPAGVGVGTDTFQVQGDFLMVMDSSAAFSLQIDGKEALIDVERGMVFEGEYQSLRFINQGAASVTVKLYVGAGKAIDFRPLTRANPPGRQKLLLNGVIGNNAVFANAPFLEAADPTRYEVIFTTGAANAGNVVLLAINAAGGQIIQAVPNSTQRAYWAGPIYAHSQNLTDTAVITGLYY